MSKNLKKFPAGKYYIGDPCYLFDESWDKILQENHFFDDEDQVINGHPVLVDGTAYGDGCFYGNFEGHIPVDSGTIGILPVELIDLDKKTSIEEIQNDGFGIIVEFAKEIDCYTEDGIFHFGDITIDTGDCDEDDEDYWDEDEEDEDYWDDEDCCEDDCDGLCQDCSDED